MSYRLKLITLLSFTILSLLWVLPSYADSKVASESYENTLCHRPGFKCESVYAGETWARRFPNKNEREIVMRLNRANVALSYLDHIVVPTDWRKVSYESLSPLPQRMNTHGRKLLYVDLSVFAFAAYDHNGNMVMWGPASGGKAWCKDTNESCKTAQGIFHVYRIQGPLCESSKYPLDTRGGAPMPYCMHYYKGFALHGSTLVGFKNSSRGCVRLFYSDAKWLNKNFVNRGLTVIVKR